MSTPRACTGRQLPWVSQCGGCTVVDFRALQAHTNGQLGPCETAGCQEIRPLSGSGPPFFSRRLGLAAPRERAQCQICMAQFRCVQKRSACHSVRLSRSSCHVTNEHRGAHVRAGTRHSSPTPPPRQYIRQWLRCGHLLWWPQRCGARRGRRGGGGADQGGGGGST